MIVKGNQRSGAIKLAQHLLNQKDNDRVEVEELRGFTAGTLTAAMKEALAIAKGTRCRQFLFSVSFNPPENETVDLDAFKNAADRVEEKLGLSGQPRALVIHEKNGRRHAHAVWSRIKLETMTAINMSHYQLKLRDVSKALFLEHGWRLPEGLLDKTHRDPTSFSREEWQQAKRAEADPKTLKALFKECWAVADTADDVKRLLAERGFKLARGDRRSVVAVDFRGEVYALSRWAGVKAKDVKARIEDLNALPSADRAKAMIADRMSPVVERYIKEVEQLVRRSSATLALKTAQLKERHLSDREALKERQAKRWVDETKVRAARFRGGFKGIWDRLTGRHKQTALQNEREAFAAIGRDNREQDTLADKQLEERRAIQWEVSAMRARHAEETEKLRADVAHYAGLSGKSPDSGPGKGADRHHSITQASQQKQVERGSDRSP